MSETSTAPAEWVRGNLLLPIFGINENQAGKYRKQGLWKEGIHYRKDPVKRIVYNTQRITKWLAS